MLPRSAKAQGVPPSSNSAVAVDRRSTGGRTECAVHGPDEIGPGGVKIGPHAAYPQRGRYDSERERQYISAATGHPPGRVAAAGGWCTPAPALTWQRQPAVAGRTGPGRGIYPTMARADRGLTSTDRCHCPSGPCVTAHPESMAAPRMLNRLLCQLARLAHQPTANIRDTIAQRRCGGGPGGQDGMKPKHVQSGQRLT